MMNPVAVGVELGLGEGFVKGDGVSFAEFASLFPGVALDLEALKGFLVGEVTKKGVSELVEEKEAKIVVGF